MEPTGPAQDKQRAALADLARLRSEGDALSGFFGGLFGRVGPHFAAADAPGNDPIERWGRRIGRALGALALVALCGYLYVTYVH